MGNRAQNSKKDQKNVLGDCPPEKGSQRRLEVTLGLTNISCSQIVLPPHLERIREKLAENIHELWALTRIEQGWTYGPVRGCLQHEGVRLELLGGSEHGSLTEGTVAGGRAFRALGELGFGVAEVRVGG